MKLIGYPSVSNVESWEELRRYTANFLDKLPAILNGGIQFVDNIRSQGPIEFKVTGALVVVKISHTLGYVPAGYLLCYQNSSAVVYAADGGAFPWTDTEIYLTASAVVTGKVILF